MAKSRSSTKISCWPERRAEDARLAGVGIAHQRHAEHRVAAGAEILAVPLDALELGLQSLDPATDDPAVGLQLGLARPPEADAAADTGEVGPHPGEPRQQVFQLRQLHLQLGLVASGPGGEDVEDDLGPVHHPDLERALQIHPLHRAQLLVEDDQRGARLRDRAGHFLDLAFADEGRGIRCGDLLGDPAHDFGAGGVHEAGELFEVIGHVPGVSRPLARGGDQNGTLDRVADFDGCSADGSWSSPLSGRWRPACTPARLSGTRPSLVNGTLCAPHGVWIVSCPFISYGISPELNAACSAVPTPGPLEAERQRQRGMAALIEIEVVGVAHVPHVRPFDVEAECNLGAAQIEGVRVLQSQLELELPTPHTDVAHQHALELHLRVLQRVAHGRAAGQRGREHQGSRSTSEPHPRLLVDRKDTARRDERRCRGSHGVIPSAGSSARFEGPADPSLRSG